MLHGKSWQLFIKTADKLFMQTGKRVGTISGRNNPEPPLSDKFFRLILAFDNHIGRVVKRVGPGCQ